MLLMLAAVFVLVGSASAHDLVGTWVPVELTPDLLTREPGKVRVLVVRETAGVLTGKVIIPTLAGIPVTVEEQGDRVRLVITMARGMETPIDGTLTADRLSLGPPGSAKP